MAEETKKELIFVEGMRFFKPRENAPESIKGNLVIDLGTLLEFAEKQGIKSGDPLRVDLRKSKEKGTYYFSLNIWKPQKPQEI